MYLSEVYGRGGIYAKCVDASENGGPPIYTFEVRAPKFIDAEMCKHRMLSANSSSSRAIPNTKLRETVFDEPYIPFDLRKNQKGMQGYEEVDLLNREQFKSDILTLLNNVIGVHAKHSTIVHKQHLNRYLEPWSFQTKVITGTEWDNFFDLRLAENAQPEIQEVARCIKEAMVTPVKKSFHAPYVTFDGDSDSMIRQSVARCARTSYRTFDMKDSTLEEDSKLYDFLLKHKHMSPFEHVAFAMEEDVLNWTAIPGITHLDCYGRLWSGNFHGWISHRQLISHWNI